MIKKIIYSLFYAFVTAVLTTALLLLIMLAVAVGLFLFPPLIIILAIVIPAAFAAHKEAVRLSREAHMGCPACGSSSKYKTSFLSMLLPFGDIGIECQNCGTHTKIKTGWDCLNIQNRRIAADTHLIMTAVFSVKFLEKFPYEPFSPENLAMFVLALLMLSFVINDFYAYDACIADNLLPAAQGDEQSEVQQPQPGPVTVAAAEPKIIKKRAKETTIALSVLALSLVLINGLIWHYFSKSNERANRYAGHGFEYMNGWSSTDFKGYNVYDGKKLAVLGHTPSFYIEDEGSMPILDGAEALYPLYSAAAKAVYKDIGKIEKQFKKQKVTYANNNDPHQFNGKIVQFSNTVRGYGRLIIGNIDIMFAAHPSQSQKDLASESGEHIISTPIAKEAFVFFVEEDNPVDGLTSEQVRAIYHGDIVNWSEVGGSDQKIVAFQRPDDSGSQVMMKYFMGDISLKRPLTYEKQDAMGGVISEVAQYADDEGAIGYTFRYFLEELNQEKHVKMLKIDGAEPTLENIENGTYPLLADVVCARLESNHKPNVRKMIEFMRSEDGKQLIRETGYAPLPGNEITEITEN